MYRWWWLTHVSVGNELGCQVAYSGDARFELYPPSTTPSDCGTLVALGGALYTPDFSNHGSTATGGLGTRTPFTPVSQSEVIGSGSSGSPFRVTTTVNAGGTGLEVSEVDTYVNGEEAYRTNVKLTNRSGRLSPALSTARVTASCRSRTSTSASRTRPRRPPAARRTPTTSPRGGSSSGTRSPGGNQYLEGSYSSDVWSQIGAKGPFTNTCRCGERVDNGAGLSWSFSLGPGQDATFSHYTVFSPRGIAGPPRPPLRPRRNRSGPLEPADLRAQAPYRDSEPARAAQGHLQA